MHHATTRVQVAIDMSVISFTVNSCYGHALLWFRRQVEKYPCLRRCNGYLQVAFDGQTLVYAEFSHLDATVGHGKWEGPTTSAGYDAVQEVAVAHAQTDAVFLHIAVHVIDADNKHASKLKKKERVIL